MAKSAKRKVKRNVAKAIVHIKATFNNTLITVSDPDGDTICACSSGCVGFKGSRKSTPFAAQQAAQRCASNAMRNGVREVEIRVKGPGSGRESAIS
ncbi:MAG: 30S ribosomal protein S11, partial [Planctomycetota bacterium]